MEYLKELAVKFKVIFDGLKEEMGTLRTNRPTPKLVEDIKVEYAGELLTVKQLGSIGVELPRDLTVTVWDKNMSPLVAKAIEMGNIGLSVSHEGNVVRMRLPELTQERRAELGKVVRALSEKSRIKMRTLRDEVNKTINTELDKDEKFRAKEELQKIVDAFNKDVERLMVEKLREIQG